MVYTHVHPSFTIIKVGFIGVICTQACYPAAKDCHTGYRSILVFVLYVLCPVQITFLWSLISELPSLEAKV